MNPISSNAASRLTRLLLVLAVLCGLVSQAQSALVLKQVQVITRHGARTPLTKTAASLAEGYSSLTPQGEQQMYLLGQWLHTRYTGQGVVDEYSNTFSEVHSSSYDRTLVSASSLALGLYSLAARDPNTQSLLGASVVPANVPVYAVDQANDITIRAYDKCDVFNARLDALYSSAAWTGYAAAHSALLAKLAIIFPEFVYGLGSSCVLLENAWNCYDAINVAKTECDPDDTVLACIELADPAVRTSLTSDEWAELQAVAHYAELQKYSRANAGDLLGGNLLAEVARTSAGTSAKFRLYSAHYPTLLGVLAALGESPVSDEVIPNYATALLFEKWEDDVTCDVSVNVLYKEGMQDDVVTLSIDGVCGGLEACAGDAFASLADSLSYTGDSGWCTACANESADVCMAAKIAADANDANNNSDSEDEDDEEGECATGGNVFAGFVLGSAVAAGLLTQFDRISACTAGFLTSSHKDPSQAAASAGLGSAALPHDGDAGESDGMTAGLPQL